MISVIPIDQIQEQSHEFKSEEIPLCDSLDPNMPFVIPLAAGIVELRGGTAFHAT
jgi:hypothetical protein